MKSYTCKDGQVVDLTKIRGWNYTHDRVRMVSEYIPTLLLYMTDDIKLWFGNDDARILISIINKWFPFNDTILCDPLGGNRERHTK